MMILAACVIAVLLGLLSGWCLARAAANGDRWRGGE